MPIGPREAQLRALREARHSGGPANVDRPRLTANKLTANGFTANAAAAPRQAAAGGKCRDIESRRAYMRKYMRQWRARSRGGGAYRHRNRQKRQAYMRAYMQTLRARREASDR